MSEGRTFESVVVRPVISEKSYSAMAAGRYVFRCHPRATKIDIKRAVEEAFEHKINVVAVNTINVRGKTRKRSRRGGGRLIGHAPKWKKAIVTLAAGQKLDKLYENV